MKLNERLALVIPLYDGDQNISGYVHSAPISYEVYKANAWLISLAFTALAEQGERFMALSGPRVAGAALERAAQAMAKPGETGADISAPLLQDIRRLSTAIMPGKGGWEPVPYQVARDRGMIDPEDAEGVESQVIFFTLVCYMAPRELRSGLMTGPAELWNVRMLSSGATEFISSLKTSTAAENTGAASTEIVVAS